MCPPQKHFSFLHAVPNIYAVTAYRGPAMLLLLLLQRPRLLSSPGNATNSRSSMIHGKQVPAAVTDSHICTPQSPLRPAVNRKFGKRERRQERRLAWRTAWHPVCTQEGRPKRTGSLRVAGRQGERGDRPRAGSQGEGGHWGIPTPSTAPRVGYATGQKWGAAGAGDDTESQKVGTE